MTIQEIKTRLSIGRVLAHYGLKADGNGMLRCPFHEDQKPSMRVYEETDTVYCFAGGCKASRLTPSTLSCKWTEAASGKQS